MDPLLSTLILILLALLGARFSFSSIPVPQGPRLLLRTGVHFLFVGEGPKKDELLELRNKLGLSNLTMLPEQPRSKMPAYLAAADVALVPLRRLELFRGALPSKMFDAWACGCPVILSIDGEARQVLERADAGVFVEPEDAGQMAQVILQLKDDPDRLRRYGEHGRRFVEAHYSRQQLAARLEARLRKTIEGLTA